MKVLVFGATGKTGALVVERALSKGHDVTVLVRSAASFNKPGVRVLQGDVTHAADVLHAVQGQDAVIESIGGTTPWKATTLETEAASNIVKAMKAESVPRLITVSMMGLGDSRSQAPFWYKYLLMTTFLRGSTRDKAGKEQAVIASGLDYVLVRPPILKDDAETGKTVVLPAGMIGHAITRADLATFRVDQLLTDQYLHQAVTVVNH